MAWADHVKGLVDLGHVTRASIHGLDGNCWGSTAGFKVSVAEARFSGEFRVSSVERCEQPLRARSMRPFFLFMA